MSEEELKGSYLFSTFWSLKVLNFSQIWRYVEQQNSSSGFFWLRQDRKNIQASEYFTVYALTHRQCPLIWYKVNSWKHWRRAESCWGKSLLASSRLQERQEASRQGAIGPSTRAADTIKSFLSPSERRNAEILMFRFLTKLQEIKIWNTCYQLLLH